MERPKKPYSLHSRPTSKRNRSIYYAQFRDEAGAYSTAVSTGCTRYDDAIRWAEAHLQHLKEKRENITLAQYANSFWKPDAPYALGRSAHGRGVSLTHLDIAEGYTRNHLIPVWGEWRLRDLSTKRIDAWLVDLYRQGGLAPATVNKLLQTLRTILSFAVADGWLSESPAEYVKPVRAPRSERDILTLAEAGRLLTNPEPWGDFRHYAINVLAATTGMRMGEVRGLLVENVKNDHVEVRHSWEEGYGPRPPKADSVRDVPISPKVADILQRVIDETEPSGIVFYGRANKDMPMSKSVIGEHLAHALTFIGIPLVEQRRRNLSFHGWRHFLNTMLRSRGVPDAKVREITGHRSEQMSNWYTHLKTNDFGEVVELQTALLAPPPALAVV